MAGEVPLEVRDGRIVIARDPAPPPAAGAAGPRSVEDPAGGWRRIPTVDDNAIVDAVLMARALVKLDERAWKGRQELAAARAQIAELRQFLAATEDLRKDAAGRLAVVCAVHAEGWSDSEPSCGDGCCIDGEPTGVCRTCGEPYPCTTARAAKGIVDDEQEEDGDGDGGGGGC